MSILCTYRITTAGKCVSVLTHYTNKIVGMHIRYIYTIFLTKVDITLDFPPILLPQPYIRVQHIIGLLIRLCFEIFFSRIVYAYPPLSFHDILIKDVDILFMTCYSVTI